MPRLVIAQRLADACAVRGRRRGTPPKKSCRSHTVVWSGTKKITPNINDCRPRLPLPCRTRAQAVGPRAVGPGPPAGFTVRDPPPNRWPRGAARRPKAGRGAGGEERPFSESSVRIPRRLRLPAWAEGGKRPAACGAWAQAREIPARWSPRRSVSSHWWDTHRPPGQWPASQWAPPPPPSPPPRAWPGGRLVACCAPGQFCFSIEALLGCPATRTVLRLLSPGKRCTHGGGGGGLCWLVVIRRGRPDAVIATCWWAREL